MNRLPEHLARAGRQAGLDVQVVDEDDEEPPPGVAGGAGEGAGGGRTIPSDNRRGGANWSLGRPPRTRTREMTGWGWPSSKTRKSSAVRSGRKAPFGSRDDDRRHQRDAGSEQRGRGRGVPGSIRRRGFLRLRLCREQRAEHEDQH